MLDENKVKEISGFFGKKRSRVLEKVLKSRDVFNIYASIENEFFLRSSSLNSTLMVSSASQGEGKTTISIALASLAAVLGPNRKVLLVDANLEGNGFLESFNLDKSKEGLFELITFDKDLSEVIQSSNIPNLDIITAKKHSSLGVNLPLKPFADFIEKAKDQYDLIIVDTEAAGRNKSSPSIASILENVLMVVGYGQAKREQIQIVVDSYRQSNAYVMGGVINRRKFVLPKIFYS